MAAETVTVPKERAPFRFFLLVTALAIPLWVIGALTGGGLTSSGGTVSYALQRTGGLDLPAPHPSLGTVAMLFLFFAFSAVCEETGWTGYVIDPLQA